MAARGPELKSEADSTGSMPPWVRARKVLGRVRRRFGYDVFDVFTRAAIAIDSPDESGAGSPWNHGGYMFAWGTAEDIEHCDPYHTELDERERTEGARRLEFGHRAVIAFHDGVAVFSMWVNPRNLNVPGLVKRRLEDDQWFIYKAYTSPDHRGRKLYKHGMQFVLDAMARDGLRELVGYAHVKKSVSRKGLARLDFQTVGRMTLVDVLGWKHTFLSRELLARFPVAVSHSNAAALSRKS